MKKLNPFITLSDLKNIEGVSHTLKYPPPTDLLNSLYNLYTYLLLYT